MKMQLSKRLKKIQRHVNNKRGFGLISTMLWITFAVIIVIMLMSTVNSALEKYLTAKYQENFIAQKNQFYTLLAQDLVSIKEGSLKITPSTSNPDNYKLTFENNESKVEIVQGKKELVYKRTNITNNSLTAITLNGITSSEFRKVNQVCLGDSAPTDCYNVHNTLDTVLRFEKRVIRTPFSLKTGRVIYFE